jgi:hypothetical protein
MVNISLPLYLLICSNIFSIPKASVSKTIKSKSSVLQGSNVTILRTHRNREENEKQSRTKKKRRGKTSDDSISISLTLKRKKKQNF